MLRKSNIIFLLFLIVLGICFLKFLNFLPNYSRLALVFLVLPSLFFVFRKGSSLNLKKYLLIIILSPIFTIIWDTTAQATWLWRFPKEAVSFWILGIPLEEYFFAFWFITMVLGIYTSLPKLKIRPGIFDNHPHITEPFLFTIIFILQFTAFSFLFTNPESYIKWLIVFAILPSVFYLWRKREHIDEQRLLITLIIMFAVAILIDLIFIPGNVWYYNELSLIGRIGIVPIDDILFILFNSIFLIGFYTSLPNKNMWLGKE